jgi:hypothetical protein
MLLLNPFLSRYEMYTSDGKPAISVTADVQLLTPRLPIRAPFTIWSLEHMFNSLGMSYHPSLPLFPRRAEHYLLLGLLLLSLALTFPWGSGR